MEDILTNLNDEQKKGVVTTEGPVLILAGAGSGKTRVLTHRVAYLISEKQIAPEHIMAITFTNKAAGEMRERIDSMVGFGSERIWVATFHSSCVRILRRFIERMGYDRHFTIYDTDDQKQVMKAVCKQLEIDTKRFKEKMFLSQISSAKNELVGAEEYLISAAGDFNKVRIGQVYREYQAKLKAANALDFDDLIMKTVELLKNDMEVRNFYQSQFQYVMVDEYQDTNTAQFELVRLLSSGKNNLCVVGDDDQSIYKFRGANIYNILNFEKHFPNAVVIKLEQNYRSTQRILDAANEVIENNVGRKEKSLWTENPKGDKIHFEMFDSAYEEAEYIARDIARQKREQNYSYGEDAILYRTNAQSRILEEKLIADNIPYKIIGGTNFYSRREVKDILCYLKTIDNAADDLAAARIINVPKRGIGMTSVQKVASFAAEHQMTLFQGFQNVRSIPGMERASKKIEEFVLFIESLRAKASYYPVSKLISEILGMTGYVEELKLEGTDEAMARIENIDELISKAVLFEQEEQKKQENLENEEEQNLSQLSRFLEEVSLVADIDNLEEDTDHVVLMTLHSAKGLEFLNVYLAGMEDGLFPSFMAISTDMDSSELEEERRLCYVGITRAREKLTLTAAKKRMVRGEIQYASISRFVKEIPKELIEGNLWEPKPKEYAFGTAMDFGEQTTDKGTNGYGKYKASAGKLKNMPTAAAAYSHKTAARNFGTSIQKKSLDYREKDRVKHIKFGEGTVKSIVDGGRDFEVTVDFDRVGVKKMFASFARLQKI